MCGIVGFVSHTGFSGGLGVPALDALLDVMFDRGPDGDGRLIHNNLAMGMRRLSIIDLHGGWQPLRSREGRIAAFQNGEIYNYERLMGELSAKGYEFKTKSDTEVIAHGYDCWGMAGLVERLDGMFAIALLDMDENALYLARDKMGEKPLYYAHAPGRGFSYGSSFLQLTSLPWVEDEPDPLSLDRYVTMHFTPGERTMLRQVKRLLPGHWLKLDLHDLSLQIRRYWRPKLGRQSLMSAEELRNLLAHAVESRMVADVPVGVFLSGGLDSSIVAAAAARRNPRIDTFSMGFGIKEYDESAHARAVAEVIGSRHHEFTFDLDQFMTLLPEVAAALDEPVGDQAMLPVYWLAREARKHVTVVLAGEGADEVFGGYGYYSPFLGQGRKPGYARKDKLVNAPSRIVNEAGAILESGFPILSGLAERRELISLPCEEYPDPWEEDVLEWLDQAETPLQRASATDLVTWLPDDLLIKFDRMAMAHSLEGRAPFLAPELLEAGLNLPDRQRISGGTTKVLLRQSAHGVLPKELLERKKQGFVLPMRDWLKQWFEAYGGPAGFFRSHEVPGMDSHRLAKLVIDDFASGLHRERLIFAVVLLAVWRQSFVGRRRELVSSLAAA